MSVPDSIGIYKDLDENMFNEQTGGTYVGGINPIQIIEPPLEANGLLTAYHDEIEGDIMVTWKDKYYPNLICENTAWTIVVENIAAYSSNDPTSYPSKITNINYNTSGIIILDNSLSCNYNELIGAQSWAYSAMTYNGVHFDIKITHQYANEPIIIKDLFYGP